MLSTDAAAKVMKSGIQTGTGHGTDMQAKFERKDTNSCRAGSIDIELQHTSCSCQPTGYQESPTAQGGAKVMR